MAPKKKLADVLGVLQGKPGAETISAAAALLGNNRDEIRKLCPKLGVPLRVRFREDPRRGRVGYAGRWGSGQVMLSSPLDRAARSSTARVL